MMMGCEGVLYDPSYHFHLTARYQLLGETTPIENLVNIYQCPRRIYDYDMAKLKVKASEVNQPTMATPWLNNIPLERSNNSDGEEGVRRKAKMISRLGSG